MTRRWIILAAVVMGLALSTLGWSQEQTIDPAADTLVKRMGAVLGAAEQFTVTNTFLSDETVSTGEIVQLEGRVEIAVRRPDRLRASVSGDFGPKQYFYDGARLVFADGYTKTDYDGGIYYQYGGVTYQPKMVDGGTAYVVI